jgi:hypothetical protein
MNTTIDRTKEMTIKGFGLDTGLVLFFLTVEFGRGVQFFSVDGALMGITIAMLAVMPYFLPSHSTGGSFGTWVALRSVVTAVGLGLGYMIRINVGAGTTDTTSFLPMTFLIMTAMVSCYIQFYGLLKLRLVK